MKTCKDCGETKNLSEFPITIGENSKAFRNSKTIVYKAHCKKCEAIRMKLWRIKYKEKTGISDYRGSGKYKGISEEDRLIMSAITARLTDAKVRSKKRNPEREFNITLDYLFELYKTQNGICALSGIPMILKQNELHGISLDKIVPELGYTIGNVRWTTWAVNRAKGELTMETFLDMCNSIVMFNKV